jgi:hypothetical protein
MTGTTSRRRYRNKTTTVFAEAVWRFYAHARIIPPSYKLLLLRWHATKSSRLLASQGPHLEHDALGD